MCSKFGYLRIVGKRSLTETLKFSICIKLVLQSTSGLIQYACLPVPVDGITILYVSGWFVSKVLFTVTEMRLADQHHQNIPTSQKKTPQCCTTLPSSNEAEVHK